MAENAVSRALRALASVLFALLLAQFLIGMVVNLYVSIPRAHPGAQGSDYFLALRQGVPWAVTHGQWPLRVHTALGLLLFAGALALVVLAGLSRRRAWIVSSLLGLVGTMGGGFNGASFLNYGEDRSSMLMAAGLAVALASYALGVYLARPPIRPRASATAMGQSRRAETGV